MTNLFDGTIVLVTGASGFLGGVLADRLRRQGALVRTLARNPETVRSYLQGCSNIEIVRGDLLEPERLRVAARGCAYVFHAAAQMRGTLEQMQRTNEEGSRNMAEAAADAGVRRLVHISSTSVYDEALGHDVFPEEAPLVTEGNPYKKTKAEAERLVRRVAQARGLSYTIVRPGAIYGPHSRYWTTQQFLTIRRAAERWVGPIHIGDRSAFWPMSFIDDLVQLCLLVAHHPAAHGEAFNAAGEAVSQREFFDAQTRGSRPLRWIDISEKSALAVGRWVARFAPANSPLRLLPQRILASKRQLLYPADKARALLDWAPQTTFDEGMKKSMAWLREVGVLYDHQD